MNWKNSNFQIFHHILGNCHTVVEGLRVLYELRQDRLFAIKSSVAESKRSESKVLAARVVLEDANETKPQRLLSVANIEEQNARMEIAQPCFDAAKQELAFILYLIERLELETGGPITAIEFQKIQPVENALDLVVRAHTDLMISGMPSGELLNEARNSPYAYHVFFSINNLVALNRKCVGENNPLSFAALTKSEIFSNAGITQQLDGIKLLDLKTIQQPDLEKLECQIKFPALASPTTKPST